MAEKVNLKQKLAMFDDLWTPKIIGALNGQYVKVVKFIGEYVWHHHEKEDELFLVLHGCMDLHFRDRVVEVAEGEFCIVPSGVEHKPVAKQMCHVLLFEPATTRNTGNVEEQRTIEPNDLQRL
jgi:mannose-6-phosphate isomerase-like protein (cupin superfamily)